MAVSGFAPYTFAFEIKTLSLEHSGGSQQDPSLAMIRMDCAGVVMLVEQYSHSHL